MSVPHDRGDGETMTPSESAQRSPDPIVTTSPLACIERCRTVTVRQVTNAITQLREQRGHAAAAQIQAVIRALDLTVVPDPEVHTARPESQLSAGPCAACLKSLRGTNPPTGHTCW
jgi:hypothetical protein